MKCPACDRELQTCPHCEGKYCTEHGHVIGWVWDAITPEMCQEIQESSRQSSQEMIQKMSSKSKNK